MNYLELLQLASPEVAIVVAILAVLGIQAARPSVGHGVLSVVALLGIVAAGGATIALPDHASHSNGMLVVSAIGSLIKGVILGLAFFTVLLAGGSQRSGARNQQGMRKLEGVERAHFGEYLALILLATVGLMLLVSSDQLLVMFIGLELAGLSLYVLTGFDKANVRSVEAGLKYFLFGSMASAFTLFGLSLVFGMTGATNIHEIAIALKYGQVEPLLAVGLVMTLAGLSFKIAAAPFHLWVGDTYEAAPIASSAFIATASKVAAFFLIGRLLLVGLEPVSGHAGFGALAVGWAPIIAVIAAASIVLGNLVALQQKNFRRMLAYSAVAHAGYTLLGILAGGEAGFSAMLFYTTIYGVTLMGTFGIIDIVRRTQGGDAIADFAGLRHHSPLLAGCLVIFLLSLAGLPPLVGFFGKFYLFAVALQSGGGLDLMWLVVLALVGSLVSLYYYMAVLKVALVDDASENQDGVCRCRLQQVAIAVLALVVVLLGVFPDVLLSLIAAALL